LAQNEESGVLGGEAGSGGGLGPVSDLVLKRAATVVSGTTMTSTCRGRPHLQGRRGARGMPWMWTMLFDYRWPTHGYTVSREAAMTAFAKSWRRE